MTDTTTKSSRLLTAALHSPDFALRLLQESPPALRAEILRRFNGLGAAPSPAPARPGLRKCPAVPTPSQSQALAQQLAAFARSVRSVG